MLRILNLLLQCIEIVTELAELGIIDAMLRVERNRKHLERILAEGLVVFSHIDKDTLLVRQLLVLLQSVIQAYWQNNFIDVSLLVGRILIIPGFLILFLSVLTYHLWI